jgi:hypothetical protein
MVLLLDIADEDRGLLFALVGLVILIALPMDVTARWWPPAPLDSLRDCWERIICRERSSRKASFGYETVPGWWATPK